MHGLRPNSNDYVFYVIYVRVQYVAIYMLKHYLYLEGINLFMSKKKSAELVESSDVVETDVEVATDVKKKTKKKEEDPRRYTYEIDIYEDDPLFKEQYEALSHIQDAIWIRHDKDIHNEDVKGENGEIKYHAGDFKKPHYHFLIKVKNAIKLSALIKKVNCQKYQVQFIKNFNSALKYLIHYGYDDKYQYSIDEVKSNSNTLKTRMEQLIIDDTPEVMRVQQIQAMIEDFNGYIELGILGKSVQKANIWDAFRRNLTYFIKLVDLHNARYFGLKRGQKDLEYCVYSNCKGDFDD